MILINLLPEEFRFKKRTPLKFMVAVAVSVAVNCSVLAFWAWTAFGVAAEVKSELAVLKDTQEGLEPQVKYHRELEKEEALFQSREDMLRNVTKNRVSWTRKVDELVDIVNKGGDGEKYLVWFNDLSVDVKENKRAKTFGEVKAAGYSGSNNFAHVANFLEDLELSPFIADFNRPAPPEGSQSSVDKDLMPAEVWSFPLKLSLKAPEDRKP